MLRLVSNIVITQQPTTTYPNRSNVYTMDFVTDIEIESTWKNLTTTAKLTFPKNIYVKTPTGLVSWVTQDMYANTKNNTPPVLLRGDKISISLGYFSQQGTPLNEEFNGFITKINPKLPLEIECQDNMWLLKQAQCPNKVFPASQYNVQSIIQYLLKNAIIPTDKTLPSYVYLNQVLKPALTKINVINGVGLSENVSTNVGDFRTQNETIAAVLYRLRKDYKLECFFRKNVASGSWNDLYVSGIVYYPKDYINSTTGAIKSTTYNFQQNIIDGTQLIYLRKDDVRLGIKAYSVGKYELTTFNSAGKLSTKNKRLEVVVGDTDGDIRTQFFWPATNTSPELDLANLKTLAIQRLNKMKYEGWHGSFTSFGIPYVQHGQAVKLQDDIIPERTGTYLIKSVKVKFGMGGFRREIEPHLRIDGVSGLSTKDFINGL